MHREMRRESIVTKSLCATGGSSRERYARASIVLIMDVVAIVIGIAAFAILLALIEGIDRV
jgi:hypothetical protein